jgi:signal transduction histidine kinase
MDLPRPDNLKIDSKLRDLNLCYYEIEVTDTALAALELFEKNSNAPAVILKENGIYKGMISRFRLFENMSKPFSRELFLKRPMSELHELIEYEKNTVLDDNVSILDAAKIVFSRPIETFFDPIVVRSSAPNRHCTLDVHQLIFAQTIIHELTLKSLEEANALKSELLSVVSHNLKNPLNLVMGYAKLIEEEGSGNDMIEEPARIIYQSSERMREIISQFMNLAEYEDGIGKKTMEEFGLKELMYGIIKENSAQAENKRQTIIFNDKTEDINIVSDKLKLGYVVDNLVSNAIKYAPIGGKINIKTERKNGYAVINVSDNGPGIKEEDKARLFHRFQRLSAKPTGGESSTGLGLFITKNYVESLGGSIEVTKSPRLAGAKFIVNLPVKKSIQV